MDDIMRPHWVETCEKCNYLSAKQLQERIDKALQVLEAHCKPVYYSDGFGDTVEHIHRNVQVLRTVQAILKG